MKDIVEFIKKSPIWFLTIGLGYFAKLSLEKQIDGVYARIDQVSKASLGVKQDLRSKELEALIDFRTKLEIWEHHLFSGIGSMANDDITLESINTFYEKADKLRLDLKVSASKLGILVQNEDIYLLALDAIGKVANTYEPLLRKYTNPLIDVQTEINLLMQSLEKEEPDLSQDVVAKNKQLQQQKTDLVRAYTEEYLGAVQTILDTLVDLKIAMNNQVYRPILNDQIDEKTSARS